MHLYMDSPESAALFKAYNVCFTVGTSGCMFDNQISSPQTCSRNNKAVLLLFF